MQKISWFKAKIYLPTLLKKVASGHEIIITQHGKAVARLIPEPLEPKSNDTYLPENPPEEEMPLETEQDIKADSETNLRPETELMPEET